MIRLIVISFFLIIVVFGCGKYSEGDVVDPIEIVYTDSSGNPIFSPDMDGIDGYYQDSVLVYGMDDGIKTLGTCFEVPNDTIAYNSPTGRLSCRFDDITGYIRFIPCGGTAEANRYSTTIIHLKRGVDDTLKIHVTKLGTEGNIDSLFYNGILKTYQTSVHGYSVVKQR
jgi:hypothetical protein